MIQMMMEIMTTTSMQKNNLSLVITAAGSSTRMGGQIKKEYLQMESGTVLSTGLKKFLKSAYFSQIVITTPVGGILNAEKAVMTDSEIQEIINEKKCGTIDFIEGGATRQSSIFNALELIKKRNPDTDYVAIHDGARPFVSSALILRTLNKAFECGAACPGLEPKETQVQTTPSGKIVSHLKISQ